MNIENNLKMHNMQLSKPIELYFTKKILLYIKFKKMNQDEGRAPNGIQTITTEKLNTKKAY